MTLDDHKWRSLRLATIVHVVDTSGRSICGQVIGNGESWIKGERIKNRARCRHCEREIARLEADTTKN